MEASIRPGELGGPSIEAAPPRVLVVDDEPGLRRALSRLLQASGISVRTADDGAMALDVLAEESFDVALVDLMMPRMNGLELLQQIRGRHVGTQVVLMTAFGDVETAVQAVRAGAPPRRTQPRLPHHPVGPPVVLMTAFGDVETAVQAVRAGAHHFLTKPFRSNDEVVLAVTKAAEHRRLVDHAAMLERRLERMQKFGGLIGNSPKMQEVYRLALGVATTASTVLILGESGTGKELTARAIHQHSARSEKAFVPVNCSAIPVELVESELFGHVKGAFTGATTSRPGLFEVADGGTLFLDEVGDLPPLAQVKLLRALQEAEIKRVGSNDTKTVDVRVIAATNVDLKTRIAEGRFREDLYYRLNVVAISLPPLRDRPEDIALLAQHFVRKYADRANRPVRTISPSAMELLKNALWKGNVRELENAIEHAVVFCAGEAIEPKDLPDTEQPKKEPSGTPSNGASLPPGDVPFPVAKARALAAFETAYFQGVLDRAGGNVSEAARLSGLDRSNFRRAARRAGVKMRDDG